MTEDEVRNCYAMPVGRPAYPKPPIRFFDREFVIITYRTDPDALAKVIPAPLQPDLPVVKFEFINMPDCTGIGGYTESGQVVPVTFKGEAGGYTQAMYLDSFSGTAAGRELTGFPKIMAQPKLGLRNDCLVGELDYNGVRVATATMTYKEKRVDPETIQASLGAPGFLLKVMPDVAGNARICELVRYRASEIVVKQAWSGEATLELHPHVMAPVWRLPVLEVLSAVHMIVDLTLADGEVVHDYMTAPQTK